MWTIEYLPHYYISGSIGEDVCTLLYSPTGYGYEWKQDYKNMRAAKLAATRHAKEMAQKQQPTEVV